LVLPVRRRLWDVVHFHLVPHFEEYLQRYSENCEFIFWGLHGTFPILIVASLNFAIRGRATTQ
jgi:hypothetical protein